MLRLFTLLAPAFICLPVFASVELVPLPVREVRQTRQGDAIQVEVAIDFQACKYNFKGLYLEPLSNGQGQSRFRVVALGSERGATSQCDATAEPTVRNEALVIHAEGTERYDFLK